MTGTLRVISRRAGGTRATTGETVVNIARPTNLGNPFPMRNESYRAAVIDCYRGWLRQQMAKPSEVRTAVERLAARVKGGENLALQCWCAPCACHGDVLIETIEGINK